MVNHYADAPDRPTGTRHFDLSRRLRRSGHDVTIFASGFSHVTGREERLSRGRLFQTRSFDGVRFVWVRTFPYRGNTWRRQVNMVSFVLSFLVVQLRYPAPDSVIGSTVHPFAALAGWLVAATRRSRFLFEVRDLWPQTLVDLGAMRVGSPGERVLRGIEAFLVRRASAVITLLPGMRTYLAERGLPVSHVCYLPNGVDIAAFDAAAASPVADPAVQHALDLVRELHAEGRFVIGYGGAFGRVNDLGILLDAAARADDRSPGTVGLVLIGDGPERAKLERRAAGLANVRIGQAVPRAAIPVFLRALDAGVVHATETPVYRYGVSFNKLFEYMAARLPVVFACTSAYDPVRDAAAGLSIRPDDASALAEAMLSLASMPAEARATMGRNGRDYVVAEHHVERLGDRLASLLRPGR